MRDILGFQKDCKAPCWCLFIFNQVETIMGEGFHSSSWLTRKSTFLNIQNVCVKTTWNKQVILESLSEQVSMNHVGNIYHCLASFYIATVPKILNQNIIT